MEVIKNPVIEERKVSNMYVEADTGFVPVESIVKKIKYQVWIVKTPSDIYECADKHIFFKKDFKEVFVRDLKVGDKIMTKNGLESVIFVQPTTRMEHMYDLVLGEGSNQRYYAFNKNPDNPILSHNSTIYTVFALHYCIYNKDKTVLLCANKEKTVKELLSRIKMAYMKLPPFLKTGVVNWSSKEIEFENNSKIQITATSSDGARGMTGDVCFNSNSWFITLYNGELSYKPILELIQIKNKKLINKNNIKFADLLTTNLNNLIESDLLLSILDNHKTGYKHLSYHIEYGVDTIPCCPICGKKLTKRFQVNNRQYIETCSQKCHKILINKFPLNDNKNLQILTPTGFKEFDSISVVGVNERIKVNNNFYSINHKLQTIDGIKETKDLTPLDVLVGINKNIEIKEIEYQNNTDVVFDIINVQDKDHLFYCNNIANHNCILDEAAFIPENIMENFTQSVFPTIASRPNGKIIAVSTPFGNTNWFARTYHKALYQQQDVSGDIKKTSEDDPFRWHAISFPWYEHPLRDEKWKQQQIAMFGGNMRKFATEFECAFLGSSATLFDPQVIEYYKKYVTNTKNTKPLREENVYGRTVMIYKEPIKDHVYILGADIGDGSGSDYSVLQCWDITDVKNLELVMTYGSNEISIPEFAFIAAKFGARYNCALISGERNGVGASFFDALWNNFEYENVLCYVNEETPADRPGIYSTNKNKLKACLWAKNFLLLTVGDSKLFNCTIPEARIIYEMESFERKNKTGTVTYAATKNMHDDYIMCFIWSVFPLIYEIADNALDVKETIKTAFGLEIPIKFRNAVDLTNYNEKIIDDKFLNKDNKPNLLFEDDIAKRSMISEAIFGAMLSNDNEDEW